MSAHDDELQSPFFEAIALIAKETLGPDHACTRAFATARSSISSMEAAVDDIFRLHPLYRGSILAKATASFAHDSRVLERLMRRAPSGETRH